MRRLLFRELGEYFGGIKFFILFPSYLFICGLFFFSLLQRFNADVRLSKMMQAAVPNLNIDVVGYYFASVEVVLLFLIPLLAMGIFAEDRSRGTFEFLITSPLSITSIVLAKCLSLAVIILVFVLGGCMFPLLLFIFSNPEPGLIFSGALGVLLFGLAMGSLAIAVCTPFSSQILAGVTALILLLSFYIIDAPFQSGPLKPVARYLSPGEHTVGLYKGFLNSSDLVYFLSLVFVGVLTSIRVLEKERWR